MVWCIVFKSKKYGGETISNNGISYINHFKLISKSKKKKERKKERKFSAIK